MAERQMASTLDDIRADHRNRYEFAIEQLRKRGRTGHVIDAGCGIGYGSAMMSEAIDSITSIEISPDAHQVYQQHWKRPNIDFNNCDLLSYECTKPVDAVVCFEFIEHVEFYEAAIEKFSQWSDLLIISTPNEEVRPHLQEPVNPYHFRHFRPQELSDVAEKFGLHVESWHCQKNGAKPEIVDGTNGKFILAVCERAPVEASA